MQLRFHLVLILFFSNVTVCIAQLNASLIGDAIDQGNNCFTITQDLEAQSGGVWYGNPIDFDNDFTIIYQNNFGSKDINGADGMALVFKGNPSPQLGNSGGGLGYQGISPSLVIEFDTYQNNSSEVGYLGDPIFDHIAIMRDGNPGHNSSSNLGGPIQASATSQNIEDGNTHDIKIEWSAASRVLRVYFDCELRLALNYDVKELIFSGNDAVFFGFVGSTGGMSNIHEVCFNSVSFVDNLQLQDDFICEGSSKIIDATIPSGQTYSWSPTNGISNPGVANPTFSPTTTTTYTIVIADVCGNITTEEFTLSVLDVEDPIFNAVEAICVGNNLPNLPTTSTNGVTGTWSPALNNTETTVYTFTPSDGQCANEVTLTVEVIPNAISTFDTINPICPGQFLDELPTTSNNNFTGSWSPEINNMETTVYTFTPSLGQGCVAPTTLEVVVTDPIIPTFDIVDFICDGAFLNDLPTVSNNSISGAWSPMLDNSETTTYTFTPNANQCAGETTWTIEVIPNAELFLEVEMISEPFSDNQTVIATVTGSTGANEFQLDDGPWVGNNMFNQVSGCEEHVIRVREISGCGNVAIEIFRILEYPKFFTPNGDTLNKVWNIECLNDQPSARIDIFDRYGKLLVGIEPSRYGWDGTYNGVLMPTSDYWFRVEYFGEDGSPRVFTSHFTLKR
ncbi:lectin-like domain-containing protein [Winogradskyella forsetii]|uniref:lectin-like domain-containing protein n=1 Tax=Winogradskyella forsetii TaxID=2686077 RepID=UPI0015BF9B6A|nr:T9SS type B sorting domain-containing protein [Winogradskyella forsetii]